MFLIREGFLQPGDLHGHNGKSVYLRLLHLHKLSKPNKQK
jgi:hypothetical protein